MCAEQDRQPVLILDQEMLGRLLRAGRYVAGYERMEDFISVVSEQTGVRVSKRVMYEIERGRKTIPLDVFLAACSVLKPTLAECMDYFAPAMNHRRPEWKE